MPESATRAGKIAHLRASLDLTLEELALRSDLSVETVRRLEKGLNRTPRLRTLHRLARGLGVDVGELLLEEAS